ncbi:thioesterase II family protein [Pseudoalteromonas viridis]|uniref:Thioesterase n=1 Tax=Pseudoalteromonas viridis TaxID=339617 RepID=A0ABX7V6Y9_9GAMM|nr:alpha/beta fold hydrolase [Pseudoalteromonas viridis]QTL36668.1 thioesterase [Pseudoalteromonas viridis]
MNVVCFPYAGAGIGAFFRWQNALKPFFNVVVASLPGRDGLGHLAPLESVEETVDFIVKQGGLAASGSVLFGYSYGAFLAYEMARRMEQRGLAVSQLIVAAARAPHLKTISQRHRLADEALLNVLDLLGADTNELRNNEQVKALFLPKIRSDLKAAECFHAPAEALSCPITAIGMYQDLLVSPEQVLPWRQFTNSVFESQFFDGDHMQIQKTPGLFQKQILKAAMSKRSTGAHYGTV